MRRIPKCTSHLPFWSLIADSHLHTLALVAFDVNVQARFIAGCLTQLRIGDFSVSDVEWYIVPLGVLWRSDTNQRSSYKRKECSFFQVHHL